MIVKILFSILLLFGSVSALAAPPPAIIQKIISQGVSEDALMRLTKFMDDFVGRSFFQEVYTCVGEVDPNSVKPCEEAKRIPSSKYVTMGSPQQVVIIDYGAPSTEFRFYLINLKTGEVSKIYSSHGVGSGKSNYASKFSNIKDSKQTSLGIYMTGEAYQGRYGKTLRMYGLQSSNDQAYNRDIVLHGAWYVSDEFINSIDPKTGQPYGRLGLSWGCPAVPPTMIHKLISTLGYGSLVMHYYDSLMDVALSGREVSVP